jgi:hypothetical protein
VVYVAAPGGEVRWVTVGRTMGLVTGGSVPWTRSGKAHLTLNCTSQLWHTEDPRGRADLQIPWTRSSCSTWSLQNCSLHLTDVVGVV